MDSKLLNYSKLQIPILNGSSSHNYVIMPALLSQIDLTISGRDSDDLSSTSSITNNDSNSFYYDNNNPGSNLTDSLFMSSSPTTSHNHHNYRKQNKNSSKKSAADRAKSKISILRNKSTKLTEKIIHTNAYHHRATDTVDDYGHTINDEDDNYNSNNDEEDLGLNSNLISKFIRKETESLIEESTAVNHLTDSCIDSFTNDDTTHTGDKNIDPAVGFCSGDILQQNSIENDESSSTATYFVNCALSADVDINQMMSCYVALNKLSDENIDYHLKCCVCNEMFKTLNDLCEHKDTELCKDNYSNVISIRSFSDVENEIVGDVLRENANSSNIEDDTNNLIDNEDLDDVDIEDDIDLDPLEASNRSKNNDEDSANQNEKKPRRKYTKKNKVNGPPNLVCETCQKTCRTRAELLVHLHKHNGNGAECWECGKKCASFSNLVSHVQLHTGEKPYTCQFCGKQFTQDAHLTRHIRLHTGERPFVCNICGKTYKDYSYYKTHERIHRGERLYKCKYCGKEYYDASYYKKHTRLHTGEKPYMCTVCGKQFHRSDYLKLHSYSHTDERPFYCPTCGKGFKMNYNLKIHLKNHETERAANLQYEEKNSLKNEYHQDEDDDENIDEEQFDELQQDEDDDQQNEYISLLAQVDDELEDAEADEDQDAELLENDNDAPNFKLNKNNYKVTTYVINSTDPFNFNSFGGSNSSIKINNSKEQINNLINSNPSNTLSLDTDAISYTFK